LILPRGKTRGRKELREEARKGTAYQLTSKDHAALVSAPVLKRKIYVPKVRSCSI